MIEEHEHKWVVYGTSLVPPRILVSCDDCDIYGMIKKYSHIEWNDAYFAGSNPYRWEDNSRVTIYSDNR